MGEMELIERRGSKACRYDIYWWLIDNSEPHVAPTIMLNGIESKIALFSVHRHSVPLCLSHWHAVYSAEVTPRIFLLEGLIISTYSNVVGAWVLTLTMPRTMWHKASHLLSLGLSFCSVTCEIKILLPPQASLKRDHAMWDPALSCWINFPVMSQIA